MMLQTTPSTPDTDAVAGFMASGCVLTVALAIIGLAVYFVPIVIAAIRRHPQFGPIFAVNFFLGWSLVGWVVALAWSISALEESRD